MRSGGGLSVGGKAGRTRTDPAPETLAQPMVRIWIGTTVERRHPMGRWPRDVVGIPAELPRTGVIPWRL
jgi:hypothetical protein